ncbi:MAG: outer membrane beta-barrel protein, partial [Pseudomonadota bacterium]
MHIPMQLKIVIFACLILHINIGYADDFKERKLKKVKSKTSKKLYLKVGVGNMHYRKFIETAQYERKSLRTDTTYNIGIGHKFNTSIKADINLQYHKTKYVDIDHNPLFNLTFNSKQKINILSIFINGYYGFNFNKFIIPYITVGLGVGKNKARDLVVEPMDPILDAFKGKTIKNFIWNTGAG